MPPTDGPSLTRVVMAGALALGLAAATWDLATCDGPCASRPCTAVDPCHFDADGDDTLDACVVGTACLEPGAPCEDHLFGPDCVCRTERSGREGRCRAACAR